MVVLIWGRGPQRSTLRLLYLLFPWVPGSLAPEHLQEAWRGAGLPFQVGQTAESESPLPCARFLLSAALSSCHHLASPTGIGNTSA